MRDEALVLFQVLSSQEKANVCENLNGNDLCLLKFSFQIEGASNLECRRRVDNYF